MKTIETSKLSLHDLWASYAHRMVNNGHHMLALAQKHLISKMLEPEIKKKISYATCCHVVIDYYCRRSRGEHKNYAEVSLNDYFANKKDHPSPLLGYLLVYGAFSGEKVLMPAFGLSCQDYRLSEVYLGENSDSMKIEQIDEGQALIIELPDPLNEGDPEVDILPCTPNPCPTPMKVVHQTPMKKEDHINLDYIKKKRLQDKAKTNTQIKRR